MTTPRAVIDIAAITIAAPVKSNTPQPSTTDNGEYSTTIAWSGSPATFAASTTYTATITIVPDSAYTVTGVANNFFTVAGATTVTYTGGSTSVSALFPATSAVTASTAPTIGTATTTGATTATVAFTAPSNNGGATIISYTATSSPGGITATLTQAGSGTITITGLSPLTTYTFTVTANNGTATSVASSASNSITTLKNTITTAPISIVAPVVGATPQTSTPDNGQYSTTIAWSGSPTTFAANTGYQATITIVPDGLYTVTGVTANFFTVSTATSVTYVAGASTVLAVFPATSAGLTSRTISLTSPPASLTYGSTATLSASASAGGSDGTISYSVGLSTGCSLTGAVLKVTNATGSCAITATIAGGTSYADATSSSSTVTLNKAALTVKAKDISITFGGTPTSGFVATGLQYTDAIDTVTYSYSGANAPRAPTVGGTYTITPSAAHFTVGLTDNYTITYSTGVFTIQTNSLAGLTSSDYGASLVTLTASDSATVTTTISVGSSSVSVTVPATSLPAGTHIDIYPLNNNSATSAAIGSGLTFVTSLIVAWIAPDLTIPMTRDGVPIQMTINDTGIKAGQLVYTVIGANASVVTTATVDGQVSFNITQDPIVTITSTVPTAPRSVSATVANSQSVVSWTAPSSNGGSPITGYTVTSSPGSFHCTTTTETSCNVTGLTNGTAYTFAVTATNSVGTGPAGNSASITPATTPGAPQSIIASPGNATATVSWSAPSSNGGAAITSYTVTSSPGSFTCTTGTTSCAVSGLTNGTSYTFSVTAHNSIGNGSAGSSGSATPSTVPGTPSSVTGVIGDRAVTISWTAPSSNGSAITGYSVTASPGGAMCTTTTETTCTVTGLTNGTPYVFTVVATNANGNSAGGTSATGPSALAPATYPGAPTGVTGTVANASSVVSWSAPASDGGATITSYTVTSSPDGRTCTTASTSCTVTSLTNGTTYTFTVVATNGIGSGTGATSGSVSYTHLTLPTNREV